ncbi:hypothetical protein JL720_12388 [Aureococcus anophagefferens]|nr:hypothetical protein JL720_12388 [Aureococcus anophagefferens]
MYADGWTKEEKQRGGDSTHVDKYYRPPASIGGKRCRSILEVARAAYPSHLVAAAVADDDWVPAAKELVEAFCGQYGRWYTAKVVKVDAAAGKATVHYCNWSMGFDSALAFRLLRRDDGTLDATKDKTGSAVSRVTGEATPRPEEGQGRADDDDERAAAPPRAPPARGAEARGAEARAAPRGREVRAAEAAAAAANDGDDDDDVDDDDDDPRELRVCAACDAAGRGVLHCRVAERHTGGLSPLGFEAFATCMAATPSPAEPHDGLGAAAAVDARLTGLRVPAELVPAVLDFANREPSATSSIQGGRRSVYVEGAKSSRFQNWAKGKPTGDGKGGGTPAKRSDFTYGEVGSERFALSPSLAAAAAVAAALGDSETFILESDAVADARWAALRDAVFWINWLTWTTETRNDLARVAAAKLEPGAVVVTCGWALPGDRFALAFTFHADVCWGGTCVLFVHVAGDADRPATAAAPRPTAAARLCRLVADGHAGAADTVPAGLCEDADAWLRLGVHGGEDPYDVVVDEASVFAGEGGGAVAAGAAARRRATRCGRRRRRRLPADADARRAGARGLAARRGAAGARGWAAVRPPRLAGRDARVRCTFDVTGKRQRPADIPAEKTHARGVGKRGARQRLYECLTCCPDGIIEVCPACAASCHRGHDLRECDGASGGALRGGDDDLAFCSCGFACACHARLP